jgi:hypothetical protein
MNEILKIPNTLTLICRCWNKAEEELHSYIRNYCPDIDEETITLNFHAKLCEILMIANDGHLFERTFLSDLQASFSHRKHEFDYDLLPTIARGIVTDVTLHKRETEKITGGDLGFVIIRPFIQLTHSSIKIDDYRRGLLTQAKLKRRNGRWGKFTPKQEAVLPSKLDYLSLLLYEYADPERYNLGQFRWKLGKNSTFPELKNALRTDSFGDTADSAEIITGLGNALIGTADKKIINDDITPSGNRSIIISIWWRDGKGPGSEVQIHANRTEQDYRILLRH